MANITRVESRSQLAALAKVAGVRPDWHEPDEQDINAYVIGDHLDNAMGSAFTGNCNELNVVLTFGGKPSAVVNLATLLSWAAESESEEAFRKAERIRYRTRGAADAPRITDGASLVSYMETMEKRLAKTFDEHHAIEKERDDLLREKRVVQKFFGVGADK